MSSDSHTRVSLLIRLQTSPEDQQAWEEFVDRYSRKIYQWCRRWGLQNADAEDITQGLLLKLAGVLRQFTYDPEVGSFRGWLKTLTFRAWHDFCHNKLRKERGSGDTDQLEALLALPARNDLVERLSEEFDLELVEMAKARVQQRVAAHNFEAFCLLEEGASAQSVAEQLEIPVSQVYLARSRVKRLLQDEIQALEADPQS